MPSKNITNLLPYDQTTKFIITLAPLLLNNNDTNFPSKSNITFNNTIPKTNLRMARQVFLTNDNYYLFGNILGIIVSFIILIMYIIHLQKVNKELKERLPIYAPNSLYINQ